MSDTVRSFLAFDLDNDEVLRNLVRVHGLVPKTGADVKMVEPNNIHITIRFLGDIAGGMIEGIFEAMKRIQFAPFAVKIHGVGAFPNVHNPRVLWAGIMDGATQLKSIFDRMEPQLRELGFASDSRGFSPHLTIGRVRSGRNKDVLAELIAKNMDFDFGVVNAKCLRLKRSELTPTGPIYSTLKEICPQA
jgi:2'-5' RNA ligase